ncbi:MAG TPA: transglutaminase domain-containing protein, partial [Bacteroidia bacterium]|nr:transglutaminase domain-containing protein [Bacteroidia bacterium]
FKSTGAISKYINETFSTDHEKFRAVFRWVTDNISYNYSARNANAQEVFKSKTAVCNGYSELIKLLCDSCNIKCRMVTGFVKLDLNYLVYKNDSAHAWNIVGLGGREYLVDATWAAGQYNHSTNKFIKEFDELYFLTPPETFILNHFPDYLVDQLLKNPITEETFRNSPLFCYKAFNYEVTSFLPVSSTIMVKRNDKISFSYGMTYPPVHMSVELLNGLADTHPLQSDIVFQGTDDRVSFNLQFDNPGEYFLCICFDEEDAIYYKLQVTK